MAPVLDPRETADLQGRTARGPPLSEAKQEVLAQRGIAFAHEHGSGLARRGPRRRFCPLPAAPRKWPVCRGKARDPENQECSSGTGCSWETVVVPSTTANGMLRIRDRGETAERAPRGLCQPSPSEPFCTYDCVFCLLDLEIRGPARLDVPSRNLLLADRPVAASCTPDRGVAPGIAFVAPTEQLAEERLRPLDIAGRELSQAKRTHDIDDRRADALARLPQRQIPAGWISDRGHTTGIQDVEGLSKGHGTTKLGGPHRGCLSEIGRAHV